MKKAVLIIWVVLILSGSALWAADSKLLPSLNAARELNQQFLTLMADNQIDQAFDLVKPYMPIMGKEIDNLKEVTTQQYKVLESSFGKPIGYQLIEERKVADRLVFYTYLELREKFPIRWTIIYYRPQMTWQPVILKWDAKITEL